MAEKQKIIFAIPEETSMADIIDKILKNNLLEESDKEFFDKFIEDVEPKTTIIVDAALTIAEKKLPENKIVELLQKHLETSKKTAEKIVQDINEKIIPFVKVKRLETDEEEEFRKKLLSKIRAHIPVQEPDEEKNSMPYLKTAPIIDVEENAENMDKVRGNTATREKSKPAKESPFTRSSEDRVVQESKLDTYRELIE